MGASYDEVYVQLVNKRTGKPIDDDSGLYNVLNASSASEESIYSDKWGTAGSNPGTMTNGIAHFWVTQGTTSVDISFLTSTGYSKFVNNVRIDRHHRVEIDPQDQTDQLLIIPYSGNSGCAAVVDTGFDLLAGMQVKDVFCHATVATTGAGIDIGRSGDTDSFIDLMTSSTTGWKVYDSPVVTTATACGHYVSSVQFRGADLVEWENGMVTACANGADGYFCPKKYTATAATSVVYVVAATNSAGSGRGYIYIKYDRLPTLATAITDS